MRDINFFKNYKNQRKASINKYFYIIGSLIFVFILILGIFINNFLTIAVLTREIQAIENFINMSENKEKLKEYENIRQKNEILNNYYKTLEAINALIYKKDKVRSGIILKISNAMPREMFIETLTVTGESVQMQGVASSRNVIAQFQHNLILENVFDDVYISTINTQTEDINNFVFILKCRLKDVQ